MNINIKINKNLIYFLSPPDTMLYLVQLNVKRSKNKNIK